MRKFKNLKISCLLFAILIALVACNEKDDSLKVSSDVVFLKKKIGGETRYGIAYYLQANQGLESVNVTLPLYGETVTLKQHELNTYFFIHEPDNGGFKNTEPVKGDYLFKVVSKKGEILEIIEEQDFSDLLFAEIESTDFDNDSNNQWLHVKWNSVYDADAYEVMLLKFMTGETIFNGYTVDATKGHEYIISYYHNTGVWGERPNKDQRYILKINAIKYDSAKDKEEDMFFNIQEVTETTKEITWDLE